MIFHSKTFTKNASIAGTFRFVSTLNTVLE